MAGTKTFIAKPGDVAEKWWVVDASDKSVGRLASDIAMILMGCKRDEDDAARWGGDEFTILMEGADAESAARLADSIVEMTRSTPVRIRGADVEVLVSIGVASGRFAAQRNLFAVADAALYEAKRTGRNQWRLG